MARDFATPFVLRGPVPAFLAAVRYDTGLCGFARSFAGLRETFDLVTALQQANAAAARDHEDPGGYQLWRLGENRFWFPQEASAESIRFALAQYRAAAYPGLEVRPGDVVLDCGGFVGDWTLWALARGASRVIIVEPASQQIECIRRNLAEPLRQGRVVLIPKGVWDKEETLRLAHADTNPAANIVVRRDSGRGEMIELTTIDALVDQLGLDRLDVIKMDIEGAETNAIRGARRTLRRFRPRLAIATEHTADRLQNNRNVIAAMEEAAPGYRYRCGACTLIRGAVVPETLYFDP